MSRRGRVTLSSQPCFHVIFSKDFLSMGHGRVQSVAELMAESPSTPFFSPLFMLLLFLTYLKTRHYFVCLSCVFYFFFSQQAITVISALGEMIALWIKFGGKTALHVASESAIKQE